MFQDAYPNKAGWKIGIDKLIMFQDAYSNKAGWKIGSDRLSLIPSFLPMDHLFRHSRHQKG